mgnify:CR=1 FL=1
MEQNNGLISDQILDRFKYEVAENLGLLDKIKEQGWQIGRAHV